MGPLGITFHKTVRMQGEGVRKLPPSRGHFPFFETRDFPGRVPAHWPENSLFIPMAESEALWLGFQSPAHLGRTRRPLAVMVGAGGINAVDGNPWGNELSADPQNYMVTPPQPWLDGWKGTGERDEHIVYQFVATEHQGGAGNTVAEQLLGTTSTDGALTVSVVQAREDFQFPVPGIRRTGGFGLELSALASTSMAVPTAGASLENLGAGDTETFSATSLTAPMVYGAQAEGLRVRAMSTQVPAREMGVGKGAKLEQKIYPDPYGIDTWDLSTLQTQKIYLVNAADFEQITGFPMTEIEYERDGFTFPRYIHDDTMQDLPGALHLDELASVPA